MRRLFTSRRGKSKTPLPDFEASVPDWVEPRDPAFQTYDEDADDAARALEEATNEATDALNDLTSQLLGNRARRQAPSPRPNTPATVTDKTFAELRPMEFDEFIGQQRHVERLQAAITTALVMDKAVPHMAFISEAGTGKTSLAACCANSLGRKALATCGSALTSMDDVAALVQQVEGGIMFIDEAHDLAKADKPIISGLLPLLEDWVLHTPSGSVVVAPFTCIMATTSFGMLDKALRSRMGIEYAFDDYTIEDMTRICLGHADKQNILIDEAAETIAVRARHNPRFCLNLLRECYHRAVADNKQTVDVEACKTVFKSLGIDSTGLMPKDRMLLELLSNGKCSEARCAAYLGLDKRTYQETVELFLSRRGLLTVKSQGRELTEKGERYVQAQEDR